MSGAVLAHRTAVLLRLVAASPVPLGVSELARDSSIPKATCIRILRALVDEQLLEIDDETRRYRVSFTLTALMADRSAADGTVERMRAELERLSETTKETAGIDLYIGGEVVVILQVQGPRLISQATKPVPRRLPVLPTSTGKAFLTWHDDADAVTAHLAGVPPAERKRIEAEFATSRARGYAVSLEELDPGAVAIAAPVRVDDTTVCTVWIGGPAFRLTRELIPALGDEVVASAALLADLLRTDHESLLALATATAPH